MASAKTFAPIPPPPSKYKDDPHVTLSSSEKAMYDEVLAHFTSQDPVYALPKIENGVLMEEEKFWLSRECLLRYACACHFPLHRPWSEPPSLSSTSDEGIYVLPSGSPHLQPSQG